MKKVKISKKLRATVRISKSRNSLNLLFFFGVRAKIAALRAERTIFRSVFA